MTYIVENLTKDEIETLEKQLNAKVYSDLGYAVRKKLKEAREATSERVDSGFLAEKD